MSTISRILAAITIAAFSVGPVSAATVSNAATVVAQASAGSITGTAVDETGAPIVGATVTVSGPHSYSSTTDAKGAFTISNIDPALYTVVVRKSGYDTASQPDFAVFAGEAATVAVTMHSSTLTTLQTIATVRTAGRGAINTSTAATDSVTSATFANQGAPQVMRALNQLPGVQISLPQTSGNGASPGAITFPNIRGALSFETASLIDGHPVSVGGFGDYVTTFLSPYMFQGVDVIKGPGAMAPQVNYAIGGTVNFRTKDPTAEVTPDYTFGLDNHGGTFFNLGVSDTIGRLGFVVDVAGSDLYGNINNYGATVNPSGFVIPENGVLKTVNTQTSSSGFIPGTASTLTNQFGLTACCVPVTGTFSGTNELLKLRYKFSDATTATVSYLGSQTLSDQNANTGAISNAYFCPTNSGLKTTFHGAGNPVTYSAGSCGAGSYAGSTAIGSPVQIATIFPVYNREINNEPILQAEVRSTIGDDTILGRFYHAGIQRLKREGGSDPSKPTSLSMTVNGVDQNTNYTFNNVQVPVQIFDYFNNPEMDSLNGLSLEWVHPIGNNELSFGADQTRSTTVIYSQFPKVNGGSALITSVSIPQGSSQNFTTLFGRAKVAMGSKLDGTMTLYSNNYKTTYLQGCYKDAAFTTPTNCSFDLTGANIASGTNNPFFASANTSHFDERLGLEYRPSANLATRFSMGSAIAPPYLNLFNNFPSAPTFRSGNAFVSANNNTTTPLPETAFGYDLGADLRLKDGVTVLSADLYTTTLYNQLISGAFFDSGMTCATFPGGCTIVSPATAAQAANTPVYYKENLNLNNARYSGLEGALKHLPTSGWGYQGSFALVRAYPYNLPPCFHSNAPALAGACNNNQVLLGIVPDQNFTGGGSIQGGGSVSGTTFGAVSNQNVPYLQANGELSYTWKNGMYASFGDTFYGKNNSLNEPPFGIAYATLRMPLSRSLSIQISGDNIFNAYPNLFPTNGSGVAVPLAGSPTLTSSSGYFAPSGLPASGATNAGTLGPATWRFIIQKNIGPEPVRSPNP